MAWPQLTNFKQRLSEYQALTGKTQEQVAEDLGTSYGTLRFWLSGTRPPSFSTLQNASRVFKCSVAEFIDDPGAPIAGQDLSDQSEQTRFFASLIVKDYRAEDLTDDDRRDLWQDHLSALERLRKFHARGTRAAGPDHPGGKPDGDGDLTGASPRRTPRPKG